MGKIQKLSISPPPEFPLRCSDEHESRRGERLDAARTRNVMHKGNLGPKIDDKREVSEAADSDRKFLHRIADSEQIKL